MKRILFLFLSLLFLTGCGKTEVVPVEDMKQPVKFYYCTDKPDDYGSDTGALCWEYRDLGEGLCAPLDILALYMQGPGTSELWSPVPEDLIFENADLENGLLKIQISADWSQFVGIERTLAAACIVYTMTEFSNIDAVQLESEDYSHVLLNAPLTKMSFLLLDDSENNDDRAIKLYFSDENGSYLVSETRNKAFASDEDIPSFILEELIDGPETELYQSPLPQGTKLLNVLMNDKLCTVNLSVDFLRNMPETHQKARLAVFSIVNSLTELPEIERVKILVDGQTIQGYFGLNLREPLLRETTAIAPEKVENRDYYAEIYLPCGQKERLAAVPVVINRTAGRSLASDVLNYLLSVEMANSYVNPIPDGTMIVDLRVVDGVCSVTFNSAFALCDTHQNQAEAAVHSVVATLCALDIVDQVQISINQGKLDHYDLSTPIAPQEDWFLAK